VSEGNVYLCAWRRRGDEYEIFLLENPSLREQGSDLDELRISLCERIVLWNGDGEALLEMAPPITEDLAEGCRLYSELSYNNKVKIFNSGSLYAGGYCQKCRFAIGPRSESEIEIDKKPKSPVVGVGGILPVLEIYSAAFVDLLAQHAEHDIQFRDVLCKGKKSGYVEAISGCEVGHVGMVGAEYPESFSRSWRCTECGHVEFSVYVENMGGLSRFVSEESFHHGYPPAFLLNSGRFLSIAVRADVWAKMQTDKRARGVASESVIVLQKEFVEMPMSLPEPDEFDWIL